MKTITALIADDGETTRLILRTMLRQNDINVVGEASNGEVALELCEKLRPDVLFLDINMPKMNGFEVLKSIRTTHPGLAVIMISSDATRHNVKEASTHGANNFLVKPFNPAKVMDAITRSLK
jgi:two-component system chemotaxis response regulator CheY